MKKLLVLSAIFLGASLTLALPPAVEIGKAQKVVAVLMEDDLAAMKAGRKTPVEVGDAAVAFSKEAETEAMKYVLLKGALEYYVRGKDYDKAADAAEAMRVSVKDLAPEDLVDAIRSSARGVRGSAAPRLLAILRTARAQAKAKEGIAEARRALRKDVTDVTARRALAEWLAVSGDWTQALEAFIELGGKAGKIAQAEADRKELVAAADFWWEYEPGAVPSPDVFKAHAVALYKQELEKGELTGLKKAFVEKRIQQAETMAQKMPVQSEKTQAGGEHRGRESPTSEQGPVSIEQLCRTDKLLHRWSFNGTLKDDVGGVEAVLFDGATLSAHHVSTHGGSGNVFLGSNMIPKESSAFTLELWATQNHVENWARVLSFGQCRGRCFALTWGTGMDLQKNQIHLADGAFEPNAVAPFDLGREYHIAIVFSLRSNLQWEIKVYKQDAKTGKTIRKCVVVAKKGWSFMNFPQEHMHLGLGYEFHKCDRSAAASYNEMRIWNRALDERELTQNAIEFYKAGEARKEQKK